jgi:hypothetical protein
MKSRSLISGIFLLVALPALAQQQDISPEVEPALSPATPARILGNIPDGTPPLPAPPKPPFIVAQRDILSTATHQQGGRTITVREIQPIALPPPPAPPPATVAMDPALLARLDEYRAAHPRNEFLFLGATVYRSKNSPPRTLVRYWPMAGSGSITFWSSADFALIAGGINSFIDSAGEEHAIFMSWGSVDIDRMIDLQAAHGHEYDAPEMPDFSEGEATWQIIGNPPADPADLVPIQSLHDLYNREHDRLLTAYQGRERARIAREADLLANPPKPKNITLNYWRTETPAAAPVKGVAK